jgi:rod shape-determining protein MreD
MLLISFWLIGIALIVMQTTLLQHLPVWFGRPDFIFVLITFCGYRFAWIPGIILVFSLGWVMDVIVGINPGFYSLMYLITFTALKLLTDKSPIKESTYQIPLVGFAYFFSQMFFNFIYSFILPEDLPEWSWGVSLQRTILVVVTAIPLFILFNRLYEGILQHRLRSKSPRRHRRRPQ